MTYFSEIHKELNWNKVLESIYAKTESDVNDALAKSKRTPEDFKALISPAAAPYLNTMAEMSHTITKQRFGNNIQMYIPLYLSNECQNICTYCGFSFDNKLPRITLNEKQLQKEIEVIKSMNMDHVLLVTGEANQTVGMDYFRRVLPIITSQFSHVAMEVQPLDKEEYIELKDLGVNAILVYQETYHKENYKIYHPKGKKSNFEYRINTPDRIGEANLYKIGLGVLLGLEDWRTDSFMTAMHLSYLEKKYWQTKYSVSFPRLRPHAGQLQPKSEMTDKELVQLICAWRLFNPEVELSISTRESIKFRNNIIRLGATSMSAGARTNPGGYANNASSLEQFEICDTRSVDEVVKAIKEQGYEVVWKDWDAAYSFDKR